MRVKLIAVGTKMPKWVEQGYEEYAKTHGFESDEEQFNVVGAHEEVHLSDKEAKKAAKEGDTYTSEKKAFERQLEAHKEYNKQVDGE